LNLYNLDIERGILSAIIFDGKVYEDVAAMFEYKPKLEINLE
jgi:replicative DNA helicase